MLTLGSATARLVDPLLAVVFPSTCPACSRLLTHPTRGPLCESCWQRLPRHHGSRCSCGGTLATPLGSCSRCRRGLQHLAGGMSLGPYEGALRTLVHQFKYRGRRRVAARLAEEMLRETAVRDLLLHSDVVVPVPLHPRRRRERGFNQAELLARELGQRTGRPCAASALVRRKDTAAQTGLSAAARRRNVAGAFAVRRWAQVVDRVVVLVDDVVTTGATSRACAQALRRAGAREVRLLTVARVN